MYSYWSPHWRCEQCLHHPTFFTEVTLQLLRNNIHLTNFVTFLVGFLVYIPNFYSLIFFRILQGVCVGVYCALIPMTVREFAPTPLSGRLGTFCALNTCIGVFIAYFLTYVLKKITGDFTC